MNTYHVTYYYLATGMEQGADTRDFGNVEAASKDAAIRKVVHEFYSDRSKSDQEFLAGCLTAKEVKDKKSGGA